MRSFLLLKIISRFGWLRKGIGMAKRKNFLTVLRCKCSWQLYLFDRQVWVWSQVIQIDFCIGYLATLQDEEYVEMLASRDKYLLLGNVRFKCQPVATVALLRKTFYVCDCMYRRRNSNGYSYRKSERFQDCYRWFSYVWARVTLITVWDIRS